MTAYQGWSMCFKLLAVALVLMNVPHVAGAQPATGKVPRMGILVIESRWAEGQYDQLPAIAGELIRAPAGCQCHEQTGNPHCHA